MRMSAKYGRRMAPLQPCHGRAVELPPPCGELVISVLSVPCKRSRDIPGTGNVSQTAARSKTCSEILSKLERSLPGTTKNGRRATTLVGIAQARYGLRHRV